MDDIDSVVDRFIHVKDQKWHIHESTLFRILNLPKCNDEENSEVLDIVLKAVQSGIYPHSKTCIAGGPMDITDCSYRISYTFHGRKNVNRSRWFKISSTPLIP